MRHIEYRYIEKAGWPLRGPWDAEPDKVQWPDRETGLPCLAVRHARSGHWCGYVGVSQGHPFFAVDYSQCANGCCDDYCSHRPESILEVHGGITFSGFCVENDKEHGICHVVEPGEDDKAWWLGFDCAHSGDKSPAYAAGVLDFPGDRYRRLEYVKRECRDLAKQLAEMSENREI